MSSQPEYRGTFGPSGPPEIPGVDEIRNVFVDRLEARLGKLFARIDDALYDLADRSESEAQYRAYFNAMRSLRRCRSAIERRFLSALGPRARSASSISGETRAFAGLPGGRVGFAPQPAMEEDLAVRNLVSKAENRYQRSLREIEAILREFGFEAHLTEELAALQPASIGHAFQSALDEGEGLSLPIRLVVLKLFDKQVMDSLGRAYDCVLALLHGEDEEAFSPGSELTQDWSSQLDVSTLQISPRVSAGIDAHGESALTADLIRALTRVQRGPGIRLGLSSAPEQLRREIADALAREGVVGSLVDEADGLAMDTVLLLFEHLSQGPDLPSAIKVLIARMQIPYLKIALSDRSLFTNPAHPARRLLNRIAEAAIGWCDDGDRSPDGLYGRIERIVEQVVGYFEGDLGLIESLDTELASYLQRFQEAARSAEIRMLAAVEEREREAGVRRRVLALVEERVSQYAELPDAVLAMLRHGWSRVLIRAWLTAGKAGADFNEAVDVMDTLIWSVCAKREQADRRLLLRRIPTLLRNLRSHLSDVGLDQRLVGDWFRELQAVHVAALAGGGQNAELRPVSRTQNANAPFGEDSGDYDRNRAEHPGVQEPNLLPQLHPGVWVEWLRDDVPAQRMKLIWRGLDPGHFLFVDRRGHKVADLDLEDVRQLVARDRLRVLGPAGESIIDRTFEAIRPQRNC